MSDGRFEKENFAAGAAGNASEEVRPGRNALIEAFGLIDDNYIDEARDPYDAPMPVLPADNTIAAEGDNAPAARRSAPGKTGSGRRSRGLHVWFASAAAVLVLVLTIAVAAITSRKGLATKAKQAIKPGRYDGVVINDPRSESKSDGMPQATETEHAPNNIESTVDEPKNRTEKPSFPLTPGDDIDSPEPAASPTDEIESGFPGYGYLKVNDKSYWTAQELADAARVVFAGEVKNVSFRILDSDGNELTENAAEHSGAMLYTVYNVAVTNVLKMPIDARQFIHSGADSAGSRYHVLIAVPGGLEGVNTAEQLDVMLSAGYSRGLEAIPVIRGMRPLSKDGTYVFFLKPFGDYCTPLTTAQFAYPSDAEGSDWQPLF